MSRAAMLSWSIIPINLIVFWTYATQQQPDWLFFVFSALCVVQLIAGLYAFGGGLRRALRPRDPSEGRGILSIVMGLLGALGAVVGWLGAVLAIGLAAGAGGA